MASTSALLNKPLRATVVPILRKAGFQSINARNGWSWRNEQIRTDIWWVEPDGQNADEAVNDIAQSLVADGLTWYERASNPESALQLVEAQHDCFTKFTKAALLAKYLGDEPRFRKYDSLADAEARRIGRSQMHRILVPGANTVGLPAGTFRQCVTDHAAAFQ